jgi:prophage regulatory protein
VRILSFPELREKKGIVWSRVHVDRMIEAGKFPRKVHIGEQTVGWIEDEVDEYLKARAAARDAAA